MTIEEMVDRLRAKWTYGDDDIYAVIAALKAGQVLRNAAAELVYHNFDNGCVSIETYIDAYDLATKDINK